MLHDSRLFAALADPVRLGLVARLAEGPLTVGELAGPLAISQPAVSRHLKVLEAAGLIETRVEGSRRPRRLRPERLAEARAWLARLEAEAERQFARLDAVLDDMEDDG